MSYSKKMYKALRRDTEGKQNVVTALLDEIDRLNAERRWIPVSERLPELNEPACLFRTIGGGVYFGYHLEDSPVWVAPGIRDYYGALYETVTHWMPLPEPPESEGE